MKYNYHSYFESDLVFDDDQSLAADEHIRVSHEKFCEIGFSDSEARNLVASGYDVMLDRIVIDRYYGGPLTICDLRTRFPAEQFKAAFGSQPNKLPVHVVTSITELFALIEELEGKFHRRLLFRGQTSHHTISRAIPNPTFVSATLGETSLLPSVWRRVLKKRSNVWHEFRDLKMFEWSTIIYHLFNMQSVHEQEQAAGFMYGISDLDDIPNDQALNPIRDFHMHRQAFLSEYGMGGSAAFLTLLQHYGLYSPVLDLTTDPEVALFFSTHKFARHGTTCSYTFNGTNDRQAIIYVLYQDRHETLQYEHTRMLEKLDPQRPKRQSCVVMPTNECAMNLAGDFLIAAIKLDFDMTAPGRFTVNELFPSDKDDLMFAALKSQTHGLMRADLTDFAVSD